jgi:FkbM family methyltransferase
VSESLKNIVRATVPRELRNWLRSPLRSAEWLWDSARFSLGAARTIDLLPNVQLICHPYAYKVYRQAQIDDIGQREEFRSFVSHCRSGMLLFDIGAHFGIFSLTAAKLGGTAVAVDPSPISSRMIARQACLNHCVAKIQILKAAVSDTNGAIGMLSSGVFTAGYFKVVKGRPKSELTETRALTIDEMSRQFGCPTHVKIDVEGHEAAVLRGARGTLNRFAPLLFLELHNDMIRSGSGDPSSCLTELDELGYATYSPTGQRIDKAAILREAIVRIVARRPGAPTENSLGN